MKKTLEQIAKKDGRYSPHAVLFVYEGLGHTLKESAEVPKHISGESLCSGLKNLAIKKWGRLAMTVLNSWKIYSTRDFGEIVYLLIENKWMSTQPTDSIDDFNNVYEFKKTFKEEFRF